MSERKMVERHAFDYGGERFSVYGVAPTDRTSPFVSWDREDMDAPDEDFPEAFATELLRVAYERDKALEALADLRGVSIDSILEEMRNE